MTIIRGPMHGLGLFGHDNLKGDSHQRRTPGFTSFWVRERTLGPAGTQGFETNPRVCGNPGV